MQIIRNKTKGFYVIEAIVAIFIFTVGVLGVLQIQSASIEANSDAQYRVNAAYFAEAIIGEMWVSKSEIPTFVDGSNVTYQAILDELTSILPGVADNPPTVTSVQTGNTYLVTVTISWKKPTDDTVSTYQIQNTIF